ncbi:MAG: hypothetical protein H6586_00360 [Flavobacteriales bacterium]|nr:hypothetical protein [Flavobacteriales bacterium]
MKLLLFTFFLSISSLLIKAQTHLKIKVLPILNNEPIVLNDATKDDVIITNLKFYLSSFSLTQNNGEVYIEENSYHLIDLSKPETVNIAFPLIENKTLENLTFLLGIDSVTNVSGVMGGDLDPTKGMYWAWNSGYINFKIEGTKNSIPFEFHLGGYAAPYQTAQKIEVDLKESEEMVLYLDLSDFLNKIDINTNNKVMSPGKTSQELSILLATLFYAK